MTADGADRRMLAAATRISDTVATLNSGGRRVVNEQLSDYPVFATDPRLPGPLLIDPGVLHRRTARLLTAAGGDDLQDVAERLVGWAHPVVALADLHQQLEAWLPDAAASEPVVAVTRRLLCDTAGLVTTPWSTHAVTVAALKEFARAAMGSADDAELIDEDSLRHVLAAQSFDDNALQALAEVCGFRRLFGSLAVRNNRRSLSKAALLDLRHSASSHDVAKLTGLTAEQVGLAFTTCGSIVRVGYGRWAAHGDPRFAQFVEVVASTADDVGLIDKPQLAELASEFGWDDILDDFIAYAGYGHLSGQLAMSHTNRARAKAALRHHGGSARVNQIADTAGLSASAVVSAIRNTDTVHSAKGLCRIVTTPLASLVELAQANADDVGIVDVDLFVVAAQTHGHTGNVNDLAAQCGLVELFGSLALKASSAAATKAALLDLQRPAALADLAKLTGRTPKAVSHALAETESIVRVGPRWAADTADGALGQFAAAAADAADDVGLIDEQHLQQVADTQGWADRFGTLATRCGLERVEGRLAFGNTNKAAIKAAMLNLGRPATTHELAETMSWPASRVAGTLELTASVTRIRPSMWVPTDLADGVYAALGAALQLCSDDVGLINEPQLRTIARRQHWGLSVDELIQTCGLPHLHGTLAMADTAAAAAKAALLELDRPATLHELADITGYRYGTIVTALSRVSSVQWISRGKRGERGLLAVRDPEEPPTVAPLAGAAAPPEGAAAG